jgi:adenylate cyclase
MHRFRKIANAVLFGIVSATLIYTVSQTVGYYNFLRLQNSIDDSHFALWRKKIPRPDSIVIVDMDDVSILSLGNFKRWPRRHFATVISRVNDDGARLVFLDVMLMRGGSGKEDRALADTVTTAGNVILGYYFNLDTSSVRKRPLDPVYNERFGGWFGSRDPERKEFLRAYDMNLPFPELVYSARKLGFTNCIPDPDGVLRHIPLYIAYKSSLLSSVSLQMWMYLKGVHPSKAVVTPRGTRFGNTFIPTDRHSFMRLNYLNSGHPYPKVRFTDVLLNRFSPGTFHGRIVMIGSSADSLFDLKSVPGNRSLPGVEIHAAALSTLLSGRFVTVAPGNSVFLVCLAVGILAGMILAFISLLPAGLAVAAGIPLILYCCSLCLFITRSTLMNNSIPSAVAMFMVLVMAIHRFVESHEKKLSDHS